MEGVHVTTLCLSSIHATILQFIHARNCPIKSSQCEESDMRRLRPADHGIVRDSVTLAAKIKRFN